MAIQSGVGVSTQDDLRAAVREAAEQAKASCSNPKGALLLISYTYPLDQLKEASQVLQEALPVGAPVGGAVVNGLVYEGQRHDANFGSRAVAVVVFGGDVEIGCALVPDPAQSPSEAGRAVGAAALEALGGPAMGGLIFTPGFAVASTVLDQAILDGINAVLPGVPLSGTGHSGGMEVNGLFRPGYAFLGDQVERSGVMLFLLGGPVRTGFAITNGMRLIRPGGTITGVQGPMIQTINDKPALGVFTELLTEPENPKSKEMFLQNPLIYCVEHEFTLAEKDPGEDFYWPHTPLSFTPDGSAIDVFQAEAGTELFLVRINIDDCMGAVKQAAERVLSSTPAKDFALAVSFSCGLRGITLGEQAVHEDQALRDSLPSRFHLGVVANGEIGCSYRNRNLSTGWSYSLMGLAERSD